MKIVYFISLIILVTACSTGKRDISKSETLSQSGIQLSKEEKSSLFADDNDSLVYKIINEPPVKYCETEHYHFVDIVAKKKIDSLIKEDVKNILFYRDWIGTNGFNGYGKLAWSQDGKFFQYQYNFENYDGRYGISSIDKTVLQTYDAINFYDNMRIDTVKTSPKEPEFWMSHAADHFVYRYIDGEENCFNVSGLNLREDSAHLKSQLINKLKIPSSYYFDMLEERRK